LASTLSQVVRERKRFLREIKAKFKTVDTGVEAIFRLIKGFTQRKKRVPEIGDLLKIGQAISQIIAAIGVVSSMIGKGFIS